MAHSTAFGVILRGACWNRTASNSLLGPDVVQRANGPGDQPAALNARNLQRRANLSPVAIRHDARGRKTGRGGRDAVRQPMHIRIE